MATDEEIEELVKHFEILNRDERNVVLRMLKVMTARGNRTQGPSRAFADCAECGEHTLCYAKHGIMRCAKCRREGDKR